MSSNLAQAKSLLEEVKGKELSRDARIKYSIELAALIQNEANLTQTFSEKRYASQMSKMLHDPQAKALVVEMMDQAFRSSCSSRTADQIRYLLSRHGFDRWVRVCFSFLVPFMKYLIRKKTSQVIIPAEDLENRILKLKKEGVQVNLNHLGRPYSAKRKRPSVWRFIYKTLRGRKWTTFRSKFPPFTARLTYLLVKKASRRSLPHIESSF